MMIPFARGQVFVRRLEGTTVSAFVCSTRCKLPTKRGRAVKLGSPTNVNKRHPHLAVALPNYVVCFVGIVVRFSHVYSQAWT